MHLIHAVVVMGLMIGKKLIFNLSPLLTAMFHVSQIDIICIKISLENVRQLTVSITHLDIGPQ